MRHEKWVPLNSEVPSELAPNAANYKTEKLGILMKLWRKYIYLFKMGMQILTLIYRHQRYEQCKGKYNIAALEYLPKIREIIINAVTV